MRNHSQISSLDSVCSWGAPSACWTLLALDNCLDKHMVKAGGFHAPSTRFTQIVLFADLFLATLATKYLLQPAHLLSMKITSLRATYDDLARRLTHHSKLIHLLQSRLRVGRKQPGVNNCHSSVYHNARYNARKIISCP